MILSVEIPKRCYCDNTHQNNQTVCIECWVLGYRYNSPFYPRVWWNPILTNIHAVKIKTEYAKGNISQRTLAKKYNISQSNMHNQS
jgi:hypothetical protein